MQAVQPDVATMLLEQMRQMQAQNQREFARLEQQGTALQQAIQTFANRPELLWLRLTPAAREQTPRLQFQGQATRPSVTEIKGPPSRLQSQATRLLAMWSLTRNRVRRHQWQLLPPACPL